MAAGDAPGLTHIGPGSIILRMPSSPAADTLLPPGRRWGQGAGSVRPYLREALAARPRNPVFTPGHFASVVWPRHPHPPAQHRPEP